MNSVGNGDGESKWTRLVAHRSLLMLVGLCFVSVSGASAQDLAAGSESGGRQETRKQSEQYTVNRGARPAADMVADNLDRVAATAPQILELLNKDAGLMVEFKKLLAQDAGAAGQILDDSDLSDLAVMQRLNEDLRARVLATRLLQRYGYLLPKVNPNSDLGEERSLVLQDRAYAIAHAADRNVNRELCLPRSSQRDAIVETPSIATPMLPARTGALMQRAARGGRNVRGSRQALTTTIRNRHRAPTRCKHNRSCAPT